MKIGDLVRLDSKYTNRRIIGIVVKIDNPALIYANVQIRLSNGLRHSYRETQLLVLNKNKQSIV